MPTVDRKYSRPNEVVNSPRRCMSPNDLGGTQTSVMGEHDLASTQAHYSTHVQEQNMAKTASLYSSITNKETANNNRNDENHPITTYRL